MSDEGGQIRPPNPEREKIYKPNPREEAPARVYTQCAIPLVFVAEIKTKQIEQWRIWLRRHGLPSLEALEVRITKAGTPGYALPGYWPPDEASTKLLEWVNFFSQRLDHIAANADFRSAS
ncbi:MAG TPA: hypothetical protein VGO22_07645 [Pseudorhizobium sp.]|jgi:hypothetical protein|nr:hypothetical protein [Pseudorhizobium sp.]